MSDSLQRLENECRRAAADFLSLDWGSSKSKVEAAVNELLSHSRRFTDSMAFLMKESTKLPVQAEPARRLNVLVGTVSMLRTWRRHAESFPLEEPAAREESLDRSAVA
jgi:hypothetical protein